ELAVSRTAIQVLEADYAKLHTEVGAPRDLLEPAGPSVAGNDRDLAEVVSAIRHVVATLKDFDHLQWKYNLYAEGAETPMEPAAWITTELSLHLSNLTAFSDRVATGYHLTTKRRTDGV
ncbi:MAG: hypothetical protein ACKPKO_01420, partial [Candidatus Fonsibacter sp.]